MSLLRIIFAGSINKVEMREVGGKPIAEVQLCKKNRTKEGDPESYTWLKATIWSPPAFMIPKLVKGSFIAGSGNFTLRSYEKDGVKRQSAECSCESFDVEVSDGQTREVQHEPTQRAAPKVNVNMGGSQSAAIAGDQPPFHRHEDRSW